MARACALYDGSSFWPRRVTEPLKARGRFTRIHILTAVTTGGMHKLARAFAAAAAAALCVTASEVVGGYRDVWSEDLFLHHIVGELRPTLLFLHTTEAGATCEQCDAALGEYRTAAEQAKGHVSFLQGALQTKLTMGWHGAE